MPALTDVGPLAETLERLRGVDRWFDGRVGRPEGAGWMRFDDAADTERVARWVDEVASRHGGHRDVAGSYLGSWLAGAAVMVPLASLILERRLPDPSTPLWVHRHDDGWIDQVAFEHGRIYVTDADVSATHPDAEVGAADELAVRFALGLTARLTPVLDAVRAVAPFGRSGLWGGVADELASTALWVARAGSGDPERAWSIAEAVTDAVAAHTSWLRVRPRPFTVTTAGGSTAWSVKGTCCLYYKTQPGPWDRSGDSYCTTCPFRDDDSRHQRLARHLAQSSG